MPDDVVDPRYVDTLRAMEQAHKLAAQFIRELPERPVNRMATPQEMVAALDEPLPTNPSDPVEAISEWMRRAEPGIVADPGPRFFGFVNGGVTPGALAGDWLASTIDQNTGLWIISPAAAQTEVVVMRWLKEVFELPTDWHGWLTSGATMSNVGCLAAARQWASGLLGFDAVNDGLAGHPQIHVVSSSAIHASALKALGTLGIGRSQVVQIPTTDGTIDIRALRSHLDTLDGAVIIVGNAGEVNTGQFDDLNALADLRDAHAGGAWLHIDGAFGLFAASSPLFRDRVSGIERADSVASDAHKWLNVPYDAGFAFVRDESALRAAFSTTSAYLTKSESFDADNYNVEFSRRFRALAAWCSLKSLGRTGYRDMVERCIANARMLMEWIDAQPNMELLNADRQLAYPFNIVCFRYIDADLDDAALDSFNLEMTHRIQRDGRVFVSGTRWNGIAGIRSAFVNWSTTEDDVRILQQVLEEVARRGNIARTGM
jgi:glutamate/tyrosine decarboxylase-like PLP-dependent enzyme